MAEIIKALNAMSTGEKLQVMEFLCSALSSHYTQETPAWHAEVLAERENASEDEFEDWEDVKAENQRQLAVRETDRIRVRFRREGAYFDEILDRMAKEGAECP